MESKKRKVLYVNISFLNDHGCAVIAKNTVKVFEKNGWEVGVYTLKGYYDDNYIYSKYFLPKISSMKKLSNFLKGIYNWETQAGLKKVIEDFKPDIIHIHSLRLPDFTYSVIKPCIDNKIPTVMTVHDAFIICPTMRLIKGNGQFCKDALCRGFNKFHCLFNKCEKDFGWCLIWTLMSFANKISRYDKYISKFITPSDALKNMLIKFDDDINENNSITINNFLLTDEIKDIKPNYSNKGYFLYIGRLSTEKGCHELLKAIKDLPKEINFHFVGTGPEEENLKRFAKENNLKNVVFCGFKNREEIIDEYQNCITTILPCNWFENFPTTNMESFINGKPAIASKIGGIPEQVENNKTGLLFEPANIDELKECILKYWNNPDLVIEHGKNAYEKAIKLYTEQSYFEKLSKVYDEVLKER